MTHDIWACKGRSNDNRKLCNTKNKNENLIISKNENEKCFNLKEFTNFNFSKGDFANLKSQRTRKCKSLISKNCLKSQRITKSNLIFQRTGTSHKPLSPLICLPYTQRLSCLWCEMFVLFCLMFVLLC